MASKIIKSFNLDLSDIPAAGESRAFSITGDQGAELKLDIRDNTTGYYYNFVTNLFQAAKASLETTIGDTRFESVVVFPAVTGADDQWLYGF